MVVCVSRRRGHLAQQNFKPLDALAASKAAIRNTPPKRPGRSAPIVHVPLARDFPCFCILDYVALFHGAFARGSFTLRILFTLAAPLLYIYNFINLVPWHYDT